MHSIQFSVVAGALSEDVREAAQLAREEGFGGVQVDAYGSMRLPDLSGTGQRDYRQIWAAQNQSLVSVRVELRPKGFGPGADVDRLLNGLRRAMEAAKGLGVPLVCVDLGALPEPAKAAVVRPKVDASKAGLILLPESFVVDAPPETPGSPPPDPAFVAQVDGAMGELGSLADRLSVVLAFRSELSSFAAIDDVLRRVRCPWFGVDLDPAAALRDEWGMDEIFSRLGSMIRHVRGRDAIKGANRRTQPAVIGRGDVKWAEVMGNLDGAGYAGWITIDPMELKERQTAAGEGLAALKGLKA